MANNLRPYNECGDCGYEWSPRGHYISDRCPSCRSTDVSWFTYKTEDDEIMEGLAYLLKMALMAIPVLLTVVTYREFEKSFDPNYQPQSEPEVVFVDESKVETSDSDLWGAIFGLMVFAAMTGGGCYYWWKLYMFVLHPIVKPLTLFSLNNVVVPVAQVTAESVGCLSNNVGERIAKAHGSYCRSKRLPPPTVLSPVPGDPISIYDER